jgi:hypothetical protein
MAERAGRRERVTERKAFSTRFVLAAVAGLVLILALAPGAQASKLVVGAIGSDVSGLGPGQFYNGAGGVAVNNSSGDVYVTDPQNNRVEEFHADGSFVRLWGQNVVASGQDQSNATLAITVNATTGSFTVTYGASTTGDISATAAASAVQTAINNLASVSGAGGSVTVGGGPGNAGGTTPYIVTFDGGSFAGTDQSLSVANSAGDPLNGGASTVSVATMNPGHTGFEVCNANPPSNDVCQAGIISSASSGGFNRPNSVAIDQSTGNVYVSDILRSRVNEYTATGQFIRSFGQNAVLAGPDNVTPTSAVQTLTIDGSVTGGGFDLTFGGKTASNIPYNVAASTLQTTLRGLTSIGGTNVDVTSPVAGTYTITFASNLANNPEPLITVASNAGNPLVGGSASLVNTTTGATGFEVCTAANGDVCQAGTAAANGGAMPSFISGSSVAPPGSPNVGNVLVAASGNNRVDEFTATGTFVRAFGKDVISAGPDNNGTGFEVCVAAAGDACKAGSTSGTAAGTFSSFEPRQAVEDTTGAVYTVDTDFRRVQKFTPQAGPPPLSPAVFGTAGAPNGTVGFPSDSPTDLAIGPGNHVFVVKGFTSSTYCPVTNLDSVVGEYRVQEFTPDGLTLLDTHGTCSGLNSVSGLALNPLTDTLYLSGAGYISDLTNGFRYITPPRLYILTTDAPTVTLDSIDPGAHGGIIHATINPHGGGYPNPTSTSYHLEYKPSSGSTWTRYGSETGVGSGSSDVSVSKPLGGLDPDTSYDVRVVASKSLGGSVTSPLQTFQTLSTPPVIKAFTTSNVTATSADLHAVINPVGLDTTYHFEYGTTTNYGNSAPVPDIDIGGGTSDQTVTTHITGLTGGVYHFRVVAKNALGTTASIDQTFNFYPPVCPNAYLRQQSNANDLPDCRGYELVSATNAGGTILSHSSVPFSDVAGAPSRLAYEGFFGVIPDTGSPSNAAGDLYVATRTDSGWQTKYIGLPSDQAEHMGGPPAGAGEGQAADFGNLFTNRSMSEIVSWDDGYQDPNFTSFVGSSNAPYVFDSTTGQLIDRWPTNVGSVPNGQNFLSNDIPGYLKGSETDPVASPDLSHFIFTSDTPFTSGGQPGDMYDNDTVNGTLSIISRDQAGASINANPVETSGDGSHILMAVGAGRDPRSHTPISGPGRLYMRVNDAMTYDIAPGHAVQYLGMTNDGSKVYFTSSDKLTADDTDTSRDLYLWDEGSLAPGHLILVSQGNGGITGNTDACSAVGAWTSKCDVVRMTFGRDAFGNLSDQYSDLLGGAGGNPWAENTVASGNGDVYFLSPELLDGANGLENQVNLYDYRGGKVQYVTTLEAGSKACLNPQQTATPHCSATPVARMEVTPDDSYMAFLTTSKLLGYDNQGHAEMYLYTPSTGELKCVSCVPGGVPPSNEVTGSYNGRYLTNDGRVFFNTNDALVPQDTNQVNDVYEYVDGRPQLITSGTSPRNDVFGLALIFGSPGLIGVSADGTDVYFATRDTLVSQDRNGDLVKIYDARTGGGFPVIPPAPGCAAADECHGPGSSAPAGIAAGTSPSLGASGNVPAVQKKARHRRKRHRKANHRRRHNG